MHKRTGLLVDDSTCITSLLGENNQLLLHRQACSCQFVFVHSPSESFQPPSTGDDVSGEPGQEGTVMGDQDGEPGTLRVTTDWIPSSITSDIQ